MYSNSSFRSEIVRQQQWWEKRGNQDRGKAHWRECCPQPLGKLLCDLRGCLQRSQTKLTYLSTVHSADGKRNSSQGMLTHLYFFGLSIRGCQVGPMMSPVSPATENPATRGWKAVVRTVTRCHWATPVSGLKVRGSGHWSGLFSQWWWLRQRWPGSASTGVDYGPN